MKSNKPIDPAAPTGEVPEDARARGDRAALERVRQVMRENAAHQFAHHPPVGDQAGRYQRVRQACLDAALVLIELCPPSPDLTVAIRHLHMAMMTANAAIACNPPEAP